MGKLNWKILVPLALIFILFAFLRFNNLQYRAIFNWDQEQFSNQIYQIVRDHKPTLLGPRVNNDFGFFLAPYFTYLLVPFYLLTQLNPVGMLAFQIFANVGFFFVAYYVITKLFSARHALLFLFLWTINYNIQDLETIVWWPILIPPGIMLVWLLQAQLFKEPKNTRLWIMTGAVAGFFMNMHFQFIFVLSQLGLFGLLLKLKNVKDKLLNITLCFVGFLVMFTPLFIFDLRNNFLNTHLFLNYFVKTDTIYNVRFYDWTEIFANMFLPFIFIKTKMWGLVVISLLFLITIFLWRKSKNFKSLFYLTNAGMILFTLIAFHFLAVRPSEYYFLFLTPIFLIAVIDICIENKLFYPLVAVSLVLGYVNMPILKDNMVSNIDSLQYKVNVVQYIHRFVGDRKFFISFDGPPGSDAGFRYLIGHYKLNSSPDGRNPQVRVKSGPLVPGSDFGGYLIIFPKELKR